MNNLIFGKTLLSCLINKQLKCERFLPIPSSMGMKHYQINVTREPSSFFFWPQCADPYGKVLGAP